MLKEIEGKILLLPDAQTKVMSWQRSGDSIVWTNGVFDIIHTGHIQYLAGARALGTRLIVGVNSDQSVRRLKGPTRPIIGERDRMLHLAAMQMIDMVLMFEEDTPLNAIVQLKPHIIVKGGDYQPSQVIGGKEALKWGGRVEILPFAQGHSTTNIISKILNDRP